MSADTTQQATAHTPGKWRVVEGRDTGYPRAIRSDSGEGIVNWCGIAKPASAEGQANARLISASPTLLAYVQKKAEEGDAEAQSIIASL